MHPHVQPNKRYKIEALETVSKERNIYVLFLKFGSKMTLLSVLDTEIGSKMKTQKYGLIDSRVLNMFFCTKENKLLFGGIHWTRMKF